MNRVKMLVALSVLAVVSGCSTNRYCSATQAYEKAQSIPPLVGTENLKIPTTTTALKVPESKGEPLTFGYVVPDPKKPGATRIECLDQPPPIPPIAEAGK